MTGKPEYDDNWRSDSRWHNAMLSAVLVFALVPGVAYGLGVRIPNQDATAIARGNAFAATADNPSAFYYNPAGITQLEGQNLQLGSLFYLNIYADYDSPTGERVSNEHEILPVPQLGYVLSPEGKPFSFGLGIYSPFGLGIEWPDTAPFRNAGIKASIVYATINPVIAWKPHPTLSIAAGPTFNYSEAELVQGILVSPYNLRVKGHDWAYGFNAGVLWQPHEKWSFGARYFSAATMHYDSTATFGPESPFLPPPTPTVANLDFPQMISAGISFRPNTNWNIEVDVDWTDWDRVKSVEIDGVGTLPLFWNSSFFYEVGVTRQLGRGYFVSAGYFFSEASTPDEYYTPLVPDTNLHVGSLGFGYKGEHWRWAIAGQIIGGPFRDVEGAANPAVDGSYRLFTPTVSASVGYHF